MSSDPIEVLRELEAKLNRLEDKYREAIKGRDAADPLTNHRLGLAEGFGVAAMCVRDALASLSATKPEGEWVLVPRKPTEAMLDAGKRCVTPLYVYDAMLAAAPKPSSVNDNAVAVNESAPVNDKPARAALDQARAKGGGE